MNHLKERSFEKRSAYRVVVIGATGNVGQGVLNLLEERNFPADTVIALASSDSVGKSVAFGEKKNLTTQSADSFIFETGDLVFCAASASVAQRLVPEALAAGAFVIDKSTAFRMDPAVPLVVPEVNGHAFAHRQDHGIVVANPNCVVIPLVMALAPLHAHIPLQQVTVATYQSVSGAGKEAMHELFNQTRKIFMNDPVEKKCFSKQIAFNVIPQIGDILETGQTEEEEKIAQETQKILGFSVPVSVTCVRVPVFTGHCLAVWARFEKNFPLVVAKRAFQNASGLRVMDAEREGASMTPVECVAEDAVFISRLRQDPSDPAVLCFWLTCDNLRKGAALNAVQIAEKLIKR